MLKHVLFLCALGTQLLALSCSNPVTLSPGIDHLSVMQLIANSRGDLAAYWIDGDFNSQVCVAIKSYQKEWLLSEIVDQDKDLSYPYGVLFDNGTLNLHWKKEYRSQDAQRFAQKRWGQPWSEINELIGADGVSKADPNVFYRLGDELTLAQWYQGKKHFLSLEIVSVSEKTIHYKQVAQASEFPAIHFSLDQKSNICMVWTQSDKAGVFAQSKPYTLEAAWMKEGSSSLKKETICTLSKTPEFGNLIISANTRDDTIALWLGDRAGVQTLEAASREKGHWAAVTPIAQTSDAISNLSLLVDEEGNGLALWQAKRGWRTTLYASYKPYNKGWSSIKEIAVCSTDYPLAVLKSDGKGHFVITWNDIKGDMAHVFGTVLSTNNQKWSSPTRLTPVREDYIATDFIFTQKGEAFIALEKLQEGKWIPQVAQLHL